MNWRAAVEPLAANPLSDDPWPVAAKRLLTEREQSFYQCLLSLYPDHTLFIQVALSQLIDVPKNHPDRKSIRNRFSQLVADFVLCRADLSVVAVIELDDPSHERSDRQDADARKNKALVDAGIRLVRIPAGRLPSEDTLRTLIDTDGTHKVGPQEEVVLTLAEDTYSPQNSSGSEDESSAVSREFKRIALKGLVGFVLLIGGWLVVSQLLPVLVRLALQPLASPQVRTVAAPARSLIAPRQNAPVPAVAQPSVNDAPETRQRQLQAFASRDKQKQVAWAAYYSAPASCEHPVNWAAQVECGNMYMRAKKVFEQRWEAEHPSSQASAEETVLDSSSVRRPHR